MSAQEQIDYLYIESQCNTICKIAEQRLKELDEILLKVESSSSRLLNEQTESFKETILKEKDSLIEQIQEVRNKAKIDAKQGTVLLFSEDERFKRRNEVIEAATRLEKEVNDLSSRKLIEFNSLLDNLLFASLDEKYRKVFDKENNKFLVDERTRKVLDSINDDMLRQFILLAYIKNNSLVGDALVSEGKSLMNKALHTSFESRLVLEEERIKKELEEARVDKDIIKKVVTSKADTAEERLVEMQAQANKEIINETIRRQSLNVIIKAITKRGFIVDKNNIKINKDNNEVHLVALKASGERADFKIYLDGKFIYDFHHGYQGQACQKDIEPFMKDLEEVYGIHVTKAQTIWENPDKISTMKYQTFNTNKNKE